MLRLSLDPRGLAPRIENLAGWRSHIFMRLERQVAQTADQGLAALLEELKALPGGGKCVGFVGLPGVFGTAVDISFSELVIESFFPGDAFAGAAMRAAMGE